MTPKSRKRFTLLSRPARCSSRWRALARSSLQRGIGQIMVMRIRRRVTKARSEMETCARKP